MDRATPPTKLYPDFESLKSAADTMAEFQVLRNILRQDYLHLIKIAKQTDDNSAQFVTLFRACLVQLFTTIEADMYGLRKLDPYPKDLKATNFFNGFTNTFNQVAQTWEKEEIKEKYLTTHFAELMLIKGERNHLTHPKEINKLIIPKYKDLERLETAFNNYTSFMNEMTNGFFIGCENCKPEQLEELRLHSEAKGLILNKIVIKHTFVFH